MSDKPFDKGAGFACGYFANRHHANIRSWIDGYETGLDEAREQIEHELVEDHDNAGDTGCSITFAKNYRLQGFNTHEHGPRK